VSAPPVPDPRRARLRAGAGGALVLVLLGLAAAVLVTALTPHGATTVVAATAAPSASGHRAAGDPVGVVASPTPGALYVQVVGQVTRPGLYQVRDGDRVMDAVAAAGGFTPAADQAGINLARVVADGEQLIVPAIGEAPQGASGASGGSGGSGGAGGAAVPGAKVNVNTADATALETLPRVGPAMAQRIIDWRTKNGRFRSIQDLRSVSGIGDATFAQLEPLVTV
jgi:competence protein ComEA